jgi:hypothetical protein
VDASQARIRILEMGKTIQADDLVKICAGEKEVLQREVV